MILNDQSIIEYLGQTGCIDPFDPKMVQPSSIDLKLWYRFKVFHSSSTAIVDLSDSQTFSTLTKDVEIYPDEDYPDNRFILHPGEFVLAGTEELVKIPPDIVGRLDGKSSLGRLGLMVHSTAGFFDPGYEGRPTLELHNLLRVPIMLLPGLPICQMSFARMNAPAAQPYNGRYQGDREIAASRF